MKQLQIFTLLMLLPLCLACNKATKQADNTQAETTQSRVEEALETSNIVAIMSDEAFCSTVYDYNLNADHFVYRGEKPAVIDMFATWCGPCMRLAPHMEALADELAGSVAFYKVDVDSCPQAAEALHVEGIPTIFYVLPDGEVTSSVGYMEKEQLKEQIMRNLHL